jgi:hypothetical protein
VLDGAYGIVGHPTRRVSVATTPQPSAIKEGMMSTATAEFRTLDKSDRLPDGYVNPYYLSDLKIRISVARVDGKLYAFNAEII